MANITFIKKDLTLMAEAQSLGASRGWRISMPPLWLVAPNSLSLRFRLFAAGKELAPADVVIFTTGIVAAKERQESAEGIEMDMAVSTLSRLVILRELVPRLSSGARVFVYGMPGNGMKFRPDDLNAEKGYEPGFGYVHANTVGGNEAVVHHLAATATAKEGGVTFYGMNPGMLSTGFRDTMHGGAGTCFGGYLESAWLWLGGGLYSHALSFSPGFISCCFCSPSLDKYAAPIVDLMFAPGLEAHNGSMWSQSAQPIQPNAEFKDPARATWWYTEMEKVVAEKAKLAPEGVVEKPVAAAEEEPAAEKPDAE